MSKFELPPSLKIYGNEGIGMDILERIWGKRGTFTCTVANTLTSTIPGVSDAGDTPELTMFTPAADAELLILNRTVCMKGVPINPGGIPTPATLTKAALDLSDMPRVIVNGGCQIVPNIPFIDVGGSFGRKISTGDSVSDVDRLFERGKVIGEMLSHGNDFIVISESCAGGTTTALAVLLAMGVMKENLVSSSSPNNPKELKMGLALEGLNNAGVKIGDLRHDPLRAMSYVGDPMMPVNVGILIGAARHMPVIVGGGTQMAPIIAAAIELDPSIIGNIFQGTTRWLVHDPNSDMIRMMDLISKDVPIVTVNMDYTSSPYEGLQAYEWGYIKEGVGCGGSCVAAIVQSSGRITCDDLLDRVHEIYRGIMNMG